MSVEQEPSQDVAKEFKGKWVIDESLALEFAVEAVRNATPEEIQLDADDIRGPFRVSRHAHAAIRDRGQNAGLNTYQRIEMQQGVRRLVGDPKFVDFVLSGEVGVSDD